MKNRKHFTFAAVAAMVGIIVAFTACGKNDNEKKYSVCKCFETFGEFTHLDEAESCTCGGGDCMRGVNIVDIYPETNTLPKQPLVDCKRCTIKVNTLLDNGTTKVWKEIGVSVQEFETITAILNAILASYNEYQQNSFANYIDEIRVLKGKGIAIQAMSLIIGCDEDIVGIRKFLADINGK